MVQVDWDRNKERVLWRILSRTTRNQGIDCESQLSHSRLHLVSHRYSPIANSFPSLFPLSFSLLSQGISCKSYFHVSVAENSYIYCRAQQFQVSRAFLLQQAAWLYERELSQVRAQMRKGISGISNIPTPGGTTGGSSPRPISPVPIGIGIVGGTRMARTGSGGSYGTFYLMHFPLNLVDGILTKASIMLEPPKTYSQFSLRGVAAAVVAQATPRSIGAGTSARRMRSPCIIYNVMSCSS